MANGTTMMMPNACDMQAAFAILFTGIGILAGTYISIPSRSVKWTGLSYEAQANITVAGNYSVQVNQTTLAVNGSPFDLTLVSGPTSAASSIIQGVATMTTDDTVTWTIQAADIWGNNKSDSGDRFYLQAVVAGILGAAQQMQPAGGGLYYASLKINQAGNATIVALFSNSLVRTCVGGDFFARKCSFVWSTNLCMIKSCQSCSMYQHMPAASGLALGKKVSKQMSQTARVYVEHILLHN